VQVIEARSLRRNRLIESWEFALRSFWIVCVSFVTVTSIAPLTNPINLMLALTTVAPLIVVLVVSSALYSMLYGRKRVVFVLRKFRLASVGRAVISAYRLNLKRRYRLVTLYDATFPAVGPSRGLQAAAIISVPLTIVLILLLPGLIAAAFPILPVMDGSSMFGLILPFGEKLLMPVWVLNIALLASFACLMLFHRYLVYRRSLMKIHKGSDLLRLSELMWVLNSWRMSAKSIGPRSTTVEVDSEIWQLAVQTAAARAHAIVIDVSAQSENLSWEIDFCIDHYRQKTIFIGDLTSLRVSGRNESLLSQRVDQALGYDLEKRQARRTFALNLRAALDGIESPSVRYPRGFAQYMIREVVRPLVVYPVILCLGFAMALAPFSRELDILLLPSLAVEAWQMREVFSMSLDELAEHVEKMRKEQGVSAGPDDN
jgi:hypothetical protein